MRIQSGGGGCSVTPAAFVSEVREFREAVRDASLTLAEKRRALEVIVEHAARLIRRTPALQARALRSRKPCAAGSTRNSATHDRRRYPVDHAARSCRRIHTPTTRQVRQEHPMQDHHAECDGAASDHGHDVVFDPGTNAFTARRLIADMRSSSAYPRNAPNRTVPRKSPLASR